MKVKSYDVFVNNYRQHLNNIQVGVDFTDHIVFICPDCKSNLTVVKVETYKMRYNGPNEKPDHCTHVWMVCHNCKNFGQRKFYWSIEKGTYCTQKTYCEGGNQNDVVSKMQ